MEFSVPLSGCHADEKESFIDGSLIRGPLVRLSSICASSKSSLVLLGPINSIFTSVRLGAGRASSRSALACSTRPE